MKTKYEQEFDGFITAAYDTVLPDEQLRQLRVAYYAGIVVARKLLFIASEMEDAECETELQKQHKELREDLDKYDVVKLNNENQSTTYKPEDERRALD